MDESGVRVRCLSGEIVIVPTEVQEPSTASPENYKSITIIETICADESPPPPQLVICPCNMCTCSGNGTQERAVQDLLCLVDLYLDYLI